MLGWGGATKWEGGVKHDVNLLGSPRVFIILGFRPAA